MEPKPMVEGQDLNLANQPCKDSHLGSAQQARFSRTFQEGGLHLVNLSHSTYDHGILKNTLNSQRY